MRGIFLSPGLRRVGFGFFRWPLHAVRAGPVHLLPRCPREGLRRCAFDVHTEKNRSGRAKPIDFATRLSCCTSRAKHIARFSNQGDPRIDLHLSCVTRSINTTRRPRYSHPFMATLCVPGSRATDGTHVIAFQEAGNYSTLYGDFVLSSTCFFGLSDPHNLSHSALPRLQ